MKEIKSIILYLDSLVAIEHLTDEQAGILIKAVLRYASCVHKLTVTTGSMKSVASETVPMHANVIRIKAKTSNRNQSLSMANHHKRMDA